jgi:hypothetical protein
VSDETKAKLRALLAELVDERNYDEGTIAHEVGKEALALLDGEGR